MITALMIIEALAFCVCMLCFAAENTKIGYISLLLMCAVGLLLTVINLRD